MKRRLKANVARSNKVQLERGRINFGLRAFMIVFIFACSSSPAASWPSLLPAAALPSCLCVFPFCALGEHIILLPGPGGGRKIILKNFERRQRQRNNFIEVLLFALGIWGELSSLSLSLQKRAGQAAGVSPEIERSWVVIIL